MVRADKTKANGKYSDSWLHIRSQIQLQNTKLFKHYWTRKHFCQLWMIEHVNAVSYLLLLFFYHLISLQLQLKSQSDFNWVLNSQSSFDWLSCISIIGNFQYLRGQFQCYYVLYIGLYWHKIVIFWYRILPFWHTANERIRLT